MRCFPPGSFRNAIMKAAPTGSIWWAPLSRAPRWLDMLSGSEARWAGLGKILTIGFAAFKSAISS
jgi:hypothetical protein